MNLQLIAGLSIILTIAFIILAFRQGKIFFKIFMLLFFLIFLTVTITGLVVVNDAIQLKNGFSNNQNLFLLSDNNLLADFVINPLARNATNSSLNELSSLNNGSQLSVLNVKTNIFSYLSESKFEEYKNLYEQEELLNSTNNYYKIFIINTSVFDSIKQETFNIGNTSINVSIILEILKSPDAKSALVRVIATKQGDKVEMIADQIKWDVRSSLFGMLFAKLMKKSDTTTLIYYFKNKQITVYPDSTIFRLLKAIPNNFVDSIVQQYFKGG